MRGPVRSELPTKPAFGGVVLNVGGELTDIRQPEHRIATDVQVGASLAEQTVAGNGNSKNRKRSPGALEGHSRRRRYIVECVLPCDGHARHQDHTAIERDHTCGASAYCRIAHFELVSGDIKRRGPSNLIEGVGPQMNPGGPAERLKRDPPEAETVTGF